MQQTVVVKKVSVIPPKADYSQKKKTTIKKKKVAAYCRVSTEQEEQESSYEAQVEYYTKIITENNTWKNAGIYADDGKSGTNTKKRDDFNEMIKNALNGKIDIILTKSVSRFARNTVDLLTIIRKLKEKNVAVIFEKEGVNTLDGTGELLITILSSLAQEESRNISENVKWGIARNFEKGKVHVNHKKFMGYTKNLEGELIIDQEEAKTVRLIFRLYIEGYSTQEICNYLEQNDIKTATGKTHWHASVVSGMLKNEKYMGDALMQKTYTVDFINKKRVINNGIVPQYYVENNHEAIITKELFFKVQEETARRANLNKAGVTRKKNKKSKYSSKYALTGRVICGDCGYEYRRVTWARNGKKKIVWRCSNRLDNGKEKCVDSETIEETILNETIMAAISRIVQNDGEFIEAFRQNIIRVIGERKQEEKEDKYELKIKGKQEEMNALIMENAMTQASLDEYRDRYREIALEIADLKQKQEEDEKQRNAENNYLQRIQDINDYIQQNAYKVLEFDNDLIRRLIQQVTIVSSEKLQIQFKSGIVMEQEVRYD